MKGTISVVGRATQSDNNPRSCVMVLARSGARTVGEQRRKEGRQGDRGIIGDPVAVYVWSAREEAERWPAPYTTQASKGRMV